jgi:enoyl-CoA hydratase
VARVASEVLTEEREGVLVITLNRPEARNAIDGPLAGGLLAAVTRLDEDPGLAVGVLCGAGSGFCSGMDLKAFAAGGLPEGLSTFYERGSRKPLVAAVEGYALAGGLEVALTCDLLVAAEGARLGIPEVKVGLFAAGGALSRLPRRLPYGVAIEMALTGDPLSAEQAHQYGLVNRLAPPGQALDTALDLASRIARNAPLAVTASKYLLQQTNTLSEEDFWKLQRPSIRSVFRSEDAKEGPRAFAQKRSPKWAGR